MTDIQSPYYKFIDIGQLQGDVLFVIIIMKPSNMKCIDLMENGVNEQKGESDEEKKEKRRKDETGDR